MSAVADLLAYLETQGLAGGSTDWPIVERRVHDLNGDRLVILTEDGGIQPETPADPGSQGDAAWRRPQVQVRVRGEPWQGPPVEEKAQEIWDAVHGLNGVTMGDVEYIGLRCLSDPIFIGFDDNGRPEITFSVQMTRPVRVAASL